MNLSQINMTKVWEVSIWINVVHWHLLVIVTPLNTKTEIKAYYSHKKKVQELTFFTASFFFSFLSLFNSDFSSNISPFLVVVKYFESVILRTCKLFYYNFTTLWWAKTYLFVPPDLENRYYQVNMTTSFRHRIPIQK